MQQGQPTSPQAIDPLKLLLSLYGITSTSWAYVISWTTVFALLFTLRPDTILIKLAPSLNNIDSVKTIINSISSIALFYTLVSVASRPTDMTALFTLDNINVYDLAVSYMNQTNNSLVNSEDVANVYGLFFDENPRPNLIITLKRALFLLLCLLIKIICTTHLQITTTVSNAEEELIMISKHIKIDPNGSPTATIIFVLCVFCLCFCVYFFRKQLTSIFLDDEKPNNNITSGTEIYMTGNVGKFLSLNGYYPNGKDRVFTSFSSDMNKGYNAKIHAFTTEYPILFECLKLITILLPLFCNSIPNENKPIFISIYIIFLIISTTLSEEDWILGVLFSSIIGLSVLLSSLTHFDIKTIATLYIILSIGLISVILLITKYTYMLKQFTSKMTKLFNEIEEKSIHLHDILNKDLGELKRIIYKPENIGYGERILLPDIFIEFDVKHNLLRFNQHGKWIVPNNIGKSQIEKDVLKLFEDGKVEWFNKFDASVIHSLNDQYDISEIEKAYNKIQLILTTKVIILGGKSGSGKSSLANLITCTEPLYKHKTFYVFEKDGKIIEEVSTQVPYKYKKNNIQYMPQSPNKNTFIPVSISDLSAANGVPEEEYKDLLNKLDIVIDMESPLYSASSNLSGGEQSRLSFILAITEGRQKKMLFLDEPNAAIDKDTANVICNILISTTSEPQPLTFIIAHHTESFEKSMNYIRFVIKNKNIECFYHEK